MDPFTVSIVGSLGLSLLKAMRDRRLEVEARERENMLPAPLEFTREQVSRFCKEDRQVSVFDADVSEEMQRMLEVRSALAVRDPEIERLLGLVGGGQIWRVVALTPGLPIAAAVVKHALDEGRVACASHSLVLLSTGSLAPMAIVTGASGVEALCEHSTGRFALFRPLPPPAPPQAQVAQAAQVAQTAQVAPAEAPAEQAPAASPSAHATNGVASPAAKKVPNGSAVTEKG